MRTPTSFASLASLAVALAACDFPRPPAAALDVVATVNGVPIGARDVAHRAARPGAEAPDGRDLLAEVLQTVVLDELLAQRAVELGLDRDPELRRRLDDLEAQVRTFRRRELGLRLRGWAQQQATVSDAEARAWFDRNADLVRTRFHLQQLFARRKLAELAADRARLAAGEAFEAVATDRLGGVVPEGRPPWDLGELAWHQLPAPWRGVVVNLAPGQVSDVVQGDGERAWIVRLVARRVDPAVTFETERERIVAALRAPKAEEVYRRLVAEQRAKASVELRGGALAAAPAP